MPNMFGFDRNVLTQLKPLTVQIEVIQKQQEIIKQEKMETLRNWS